MRDFYRRLNLSPAATAKEIRPALLGTTDMELRQSGAAILLDKRRREIYDRNRELLATIGKLRSHLGLYLSPFWARGAFADFDYGAPPPTASQKIDSLIITQAFGASRRPRRSRHHNREVKAAILGGVIALVLIIGLAYLATHEMLF